MLQTKQHTTVDTISIFLPSLTGGDGWRGSQGIETAAPEMAL